MSRRQRYFSWDYLPTVESQTIAFFEAARRMKRTTVCAELGCRGYSVYLRYWRNQQVHHKVYGELLIIAKVWIPERDQKLGWLWRYSQLCAALARDGIILECVHHPELYAALQRRPEFVEYVKRNFLLEKSHPEDWPLHTGP